MPANFTIEMWLNGTAVNGNTLGYYGDLDPYITDGTVGGWRFWDSIGDGTTVAFTPVVGGSPVSTVTLAVSANTNHHIAVAFDGTNLKGFVDGLLQDTQACDISGFAGVNLPVRISSNSTGSNGFLGKIDEFRISNMARYSSNFTPATSHSVDGNTLLYWKFNEGSGTTAVDEVASHNGTLDGSPLPTWVTGV